MNRSVKDIAKTLRTNKNVIYRIIDKKGLEPVQDDQNTTAKVYSDESYQVIRDEVRKLKERHQDTKNEVSDSDQSEIIERLERQIERYENEIDRLNKIIESKDETIKDLTDKITETVKSSHLETLRYQELLAREQDTKLLLTAKSESRFNLFRPSTWRRSKTVETPDLNPLTESDQSENN